MGNLDFADHANFDGTTDLYVYELLADLVNPPSYTYLLEGKYWVIDVFDAPGAVTATVTFNGVSGAGSNSILAKRGSGQDQTGDWGTTGTYSSHDGSSITFTGVDLGSQFTLASNVDPLPIELKSFYAVVVKEGVMLHWKTSSEIDNAGFYIYRDDQRISTLIAGQGTSNELQEYSYLDSKVVAGKIYRYKISDVEQGTNAETFHSEVVVIADANIINNRYVPQNFVLHSAVPNPFNPTTSLTFEVPELSRVSLTIYDVSGKLVKSLVDDQFDIGRYTFQWNGTDDNNQIVESGVYLYRLEAGSFSETKQMTMLK